jgi:hypothetical protein
MKPVLSGVPSRSHLQRASSLQEMDHAPLAVVLPGDVKTVKELQNIFERRKELTILFECPKANKVPVLQDVPVGMSPLCRWQALERMGAPFRRGVNLEMPGCISVPFLGG